MKAENGKPTNGNGSADIRTDHAGMPIITEGVTVFFLSEILKKQVLLKSGHVIGKLKDVAIKIDGAGPYPEAAYIVVSRLWGHTDLWLPWSAVSEINERQTVVEVNQNLETFTTAYEEMVLVYEKIIDKKIIDMEDREVEVVYDTQMALTGNRLFVTHVDAGQSGMLRRIRLGSLNLGFLNRWLYGKHESPDLIPWHFVHIPTDLGRLTGQVRLNIQREKLKDIHPVDLADIIEELGHEERVQIFDSLDAEKAADTLEEMEPRVQRELIKTIRKDRVKDIFSSMTSAQLADLFSILPAEETNKFIENLDPQKAKKVLHILNQREESITLLVTQTYLAFPGDISVNDAFSRFRKEAHDRDVIMYIYVVDDENRLQGVVDLRELLRAEPNHKLKDIMVKNAISVEPGDAKDDVADLFKRYYFRAIPVVDTQDKLIGIIRFKDLFIGQRSPVSSTDIPTIY